MGITTDPYDDIGMSTYLLGLAVGTAGYGVAPGAKWIGCKAIPADPNTFDESEIVGCLEWLLDPDENGTSDENHLPDVVMIAPFVSAFGPGICDDQYFPLIDKLRQYGILPVLSVGDTPDGSDVATLGLANPLPSLANYPVAFSVAAADWGNVAGGKPALPSSYRGTASCIPLGYSLCSQKPDDPTCIQEHHAPSLRAPGKNVVGPWPVVAGHFDSTFTQQRSGSDVAAAHVAGAAALLYSHYRSLYENPDPTLRYQFTDAIADVLRRASCPPVTCFGDQKCEFIDCVDRDANPAYLNVYKAMSFEDAMLVDETPFKDDDGDGIEDLDLSHVPVGTPQVNNKTITMRNTGITTWEPGAYALSFVAEIDSTSWAFDDPVTGIVTPRSRIPLGRVVKPGDSYTFRFDPGISFPAEPASRLFKWLMIREGGSQFGESSTPFVVNVVGPTPPQGTTTTSTTTALSTTTSTSSTSSTIGSTLPCTTARCILDASVGGSECAGKVPQRIRKTLDRAAQLIERAATSALKTTKRPLRTARSALNRATKAARKAARRKNAVITTGCAADIQRAADRVKAGLGL